MVFIASNATIDGRVSARPAMNLRATCGGEPHLRVTAARFRTFTTGSTHDKWGQSCDAFDVSGQEDYSGALTQPVDDPKFVLKPSGAGQSAEVFFQVPADGMAVLHGCTEDDGEKQCDTTRSIRRAPGTDLMGFTVDVAPGAQQAKLTWYVQDASIGYFDADDSVCNVYEFYNTVPRALEETTVPLEDLQHGVHTFRNKNQTSWTVDQKTGNAAQLSLDWDYEITIQAVDADGVPIP